MCVFAACVSMKQDSGLRRSYKADSSLRSETASVGWEVRRRSWGATGGHTPRTDCLSVDRMHRWHHSGQDAQVHEKYTLLPSCLFEITCISHVTDKVRQFVLID